MEAEARFHIGFDSVVMILLALVSLELNVPYVLDQLDFHNAMPLMGVFGNYLCPGETEHPLVILKNNFAPFKLMLRTITVTIIFLWCAIDIKGAFPRIKYLLTAILILTHIVIPMSMLIQTRLASDNHALAHDGGTIQMEESMKMILAGRNPYTETFHGTPLENWRGFSNNVIYHVPYMPGAFLYSIPVYLVVDSVACRYDQRMLHIALFLASLALIAFITPSGSKRIIALMVFALNPFFARYFTLGTNDIVIMFWLLLALFLICRKKYTAGLLALAAACGIKQFAWFFVPFFVFLIPDFRPGHSKQWISAFYQNRGRWIPGAALLLITIVPFLVWDFGGFLDDTIRYGSGGLPTSYPMQGFHGYGFATVPLFFRWVSDGTAPFPFVILQVIFVIPWFIWLWRRFLAGPNPAAAVTFSALTLLPFMFFSRYLHGNFVGFILFWPILGWCMQNREENI